MHQRNELPMPKRHYYEVMAITRMGETEMHESICKCHYLRDAIVVMNSRKDSYIFEWKNGNPKRRL